MLNILLALFLRRYSYYHYRKSHFDGMDSSIGMLLFFSPFIIVLILYIYYYCRIHEIHILNVFRYSKPLAPEHVQILKDRIPYYNKLSSSDKLLFRNRVNHFLINKKFSAAGGMDITDEVKVMIAATCVQIMFGLDNYFLAYFKNIHILPSGVTGTSGLEDSRQIVIPWKEFLEGYASPDDGYNPGIKILALALSLEHRLNRHSKNMFNSQTYTVFHQLYKQQAERYIRSGKSAYNNYDQVDRNEYFAVAVEYFFERPQHFKESQPQMYMALSKLLRQDPTGYLKYKKK